MTLNALLPRALIALGLLIGLSIVTITIVEPGVAAANAPSRPGVPTSALRSWLWWPETNSDHRAIRELADVDRRTWAAIEPTVVSLLAKCGAGLRRRWWRCSKARHHSKAVSDLNSRSALARAKAAQLIGYAGRQEMVG